MRTGDTIGSGRSPDMRRAERGIVRGLRDEFGVGQQHQVGDSRGFSIAIAGTDVIVTVREERPARERPPLPTGDYDDVNERA